MKQLLQRLDSGETLLVDVPVASASGHQLLVETRASLISAGTERMLVDFGRGNLLAKARQQPDKVKQVVDKMRTDGVSTTLDAVRSKLAAPIPLGYCQAGVVVEAGPDADGIAPGDRVVTNGNHAEYVRVPHTLAARIPEGVSDEAAAFVPVAAIGLQGIRLAEPTLGETVVVVGLGLIGLLTVQLLRASGCRVIGIDRDPERLALAETFGATPIEASESVPDQVRALTGGVGADAVLLTLAATSDEPVHQAADMSRKRGRLVLVGVTGLNLRRADFYEKELRFSVSCSYGPGRYDPSYEEGGQDYPLAYVRWTEKRNFEAVLGLMAEGRLDPMPLVSHRFAFDDARDAYDLLSSDAPSLGVVLTYPDRGGAEIASEDRVQTYGAASVAPSSGTVGVIGAGNFAVRTLLPALKDRARLRTIASSGGTTSAVAAEKFGFELATSDVGVLFDDPAIDTVFALTRHDSHAAFVLRALAAGKHVFVEKPLALTEVELDEIELAAQASDRMVMVGFNRRFAPLAVEAKSLLAGRAGPLSVVATINAGAIPRDHWTQDPQVGGGRIAGEACHWLDLARYLVGAPIVDLEVTAAKDRSGAPIDDVAHLSVAFEDGSTAVLHYLATGSNAFPKERIEGFFDGKTFAIDNWRKLRRYGFSGRRFERPRGMDKGHDAEMELWMKAVRAGGPAPIPLDELLEVSRWSVRAAELARTR
ncbi:MAG: bi-domain-containing oxidoreductase [Rubricoccaceae bacterium]